MTPVNRLLLVSLVLGLPLLVSNCSWKKGNNYGVHGLTTGEAAKLTEAYDPWEGRKSSRPELRTLPPDRLETLGDLALQSRDYENSLLSFLQILKEQPKNYPLRYKVGVIFLLTGQLEAAKQQLAMVLVQKPDMLMAHEALGLVHLEEKKYGQAIEEFRIVLGQEPNRAKARHLLGLTYLSAGQTRQAISVLEGATALDPRNVATLAALGRACIQLKDYNKAIFWLNKGRNLAPNNAKVNYYLGMALAGLKNYSDALQAFIRAGDEAQAYNNIGVHYFMDGQYEEAAKCFQRALELRPTFYQEAKVNLHRALEKLQQSRKDAG
jgi:tetratricopeptide (TPR) repeat protein